ncbi:MAG: hypothetical protein Q7J98_03780 [Kiritimatiellia bacterium]|nr:hypothetical protein [Kiritimatiellia bacterium]
MVKSKLSIQRMSKGWTGQELALKLQAEGLTQMTENRVCRNETGRARPTTQERETISRLMGARPWELEI